MFSSREMPVMRARITTRFLVAGVLILLYGSSVLYRQSHKLPTLGVNNRQVSKLKSVDRKSFEKAGNATLGFQKIFYLNLDYRYDYQDAMVIQSYLTGIDYETIYGVDGASLEALKYVGVAPSSNEGSLGKGNKAYTRSHANVWRQIVAEKLTTALILESDATWDLNIKNITQNFAQSLHTFLNSAISSSNTSLKLDSASEPTADDPYDSRQWDILPFGYCTDNGNAQIYMKYPDYDTEDALYREEEVVLDTLNNERIVRKSSAPLCSTGYALTLKGALKLLTRAATNLDIPADKMIRELLEAEYLIGYAAFPPLFAQWDYINDIAADRLNSDVKGSDGKADINRGKFDKAWKKVKNSNMVWKISDAYGDHSFRNWTLASLDSYLYPEKPAPYEDPYIVEANRLREGG